MRRLRELAVLLLLCLIVGCSAYGKHIEKGDAHYKNGDYASALAHYEKALEIDPEADEAKDKVRSTKGMLVGEYRTQVEQSIKAGDPLGAVMAAKKAWITAPQNQVTTEIVDLAASTADARSRELVGSKDFATGLMLTESVETNLPTKSGDFAAKSNNIKREWAQFLEVRAGEATTAKQFGTAILVNAKIVQLTGDPRAAANVANLKEQLLADYTYQVRLKPKSGKLNSKITGKVASYRVGTLRVTHQSDGPFAAVFSFGATIPKFSKEVTTRQEFVRYQSGTQQVENPFYQNRVDDLEREERSLLDDQEDVTKYENDVARYQEQVAREGDTPNTSTGAEQSLSRARSSLERARNDVNDQRRRVQSASEELRAEPQTKTEPVYSDWEFTVETHALTAVSDLTGTLKHTDMRSPLGVSKVVSSTATDDRHDAQPIPKVQGDPLDLPSKEDMIIAIAAESAKVLTANVDESFSLWRESLLQTALSQGASRADGLAIYIFTDPRRSSPQASNEIKAELGIPDSVALLDGLQQ